MVYLYPIKLLLLSFDYMLLLLTPKHELIKVRRLKSSRFLHDLSYLFILSMGGLQSDDYFPNATGHGLHSEAAIGYDVATSVSLELAIGLNRYGLDFNPEPGDPLVAGGGTDQFFTAAITLAYHAD